ncbi:MAG: helix-turn-helix transcriptional regulator [Betaproteobacteria bacterium]|nr:helix-turn-helix transcriptional regulator [Betaproteobacteria bacterium]
MDDLAAAAPHALARSLASMQDSNCSPILAPRRSHGRSTARSCQTPAPPDHRPTAARDRRRCPARCPRRRGPEAITTQAIADRMGVTQGALFRHFPDKEAIWLAVFAWVRESLGTVFATALEEADSPPERLEAAFHAHVAFIAANHGFAHRVSRAAVPG